MRLVNTTVLGALVGSFLACSSASAILIDDFNGLDPLDSSWTVTGSNLAVFTAAKTSNRLRFIRGESSTDAYAWAAASRSIEASTSVSAKLKSTVSDYGNSGGSASFTFTATDASNNQVSIVLGSITDDYLSFLIKYNGVDTWAGTSGPDNSHVFSFTNTGDHTEVLVGEYTVWTSPDAGLGDITKVTFGATRWWEWHSFTVEDLMATPVPEPMTAAVLTSGMALLAARRRKA